MSFYIVEVDNDGFKIYDSGGTLIDPATDAVVQAIRDRIGEVSATPTAYTLQDRLKSTLTTLDSIKDTDGIKKITDSLPAGTNEIGKVAQGTRAAASASWPIYLADSTGNVIGVVSDSGVYRVQADAKIGIGASNLVHLDAIDTDTGKGRLKTTLYSVEGEAVAFSSVSSNPESIKNEFVKNGSNESLLVDGSSTPVVFTYDADATQDISLQEIKFIVASNSITFGTGYFGATSGPLSNGLLVEIIAGGNTGTVANLSRNEDFVTFASPGGFTWVVSSKDMMSATYVLGGALTLVGGTSDKVRLTVRDDIDSAGVYFQCLVKGNILA